MELTVFERLILLNILPTAGNILTIRTIRELRGKLAFNDSEHQALQFKNIYECSECGKAAEAPVTEVRPPICCDRQMASSGGVQWLNDADQEKDIEIGETSKAIIKSTLEQLNDEERLTEQHLSLYDKFC